MSVDRWLVSGGSWGATLALAYAAHHREHVSGVLLRGVFLAGRADLDWYFHGAGALAAEAHEQFMMHIPRRWRRRVLTYLERSLRGDDADKCLRLAAAWQRYEAALNGPDPATPQAVPAPDGGSAALCAKYKIQAHFLVQRCFLGHAAVLRAAAALRGVPVALIHGSRDLVCLPIQDVPSQWARNQKRVSTPFAADYGEFALHYSYNYPELLKILN